VELRLRPDASGGASGRLAQPQGGGDGQRRGRSDVNIDNGMSAADAAQQIIAGLAAGQRTIEVVEGMEKMALQLRTADPERLFSITAAEGARLAQERATHGSADVDPGNVQRLDS